MSGCSTGRSEPIDSISLASCACAHVSGEAEQWLDKAEERPGSWWPDWDAWLKRHSSGTVPAPAGPGSATYRAIEPAPGRYVKLKSN